MRAPALLEGAPRLSGGRASGARARSTWNSHQRPRAALAPHEAAPLPHRGQSLNVHARSTWNTAPASTRLSFSLMEPPQPSAARLRTLRARSTWNSGAPSRRRPPTLRGRHPNAPCTFHVEHPRAQSLEARLHSRSTWNNPERHHAPPPLRAAASSTSDGPPKDSRARSTWNIVTARTRLFVFMRRLHPPSAGKSLNAPLTFHVEQS